jgi:hypothetical protein
MKGFVGPLGDDIPGVFPIVLGVVLFVSSLLYANNQIQNANAQMDLQNAGLSLSYVVSQNAYLTPQQFQSYCDNMWRPYAKNLNLKFIIVVKTYCQQGVNFEENPFRYCQTPTIDQTTNLAEPHSDLKSPYTCYSNDTQTRNLLQGSNGNGLLGYTSSTSLASALPSNAVILSFPIAVNCPTTASILQNSPTSGRCDHVEGSMTYGVGTLNVMVWR